MTDLSEEQLRDGVVKDWAVHCRSCLNTDNPPPLHFVVDKDGVFYYSCKKDVNRGRPDNHIYCLLGGAFSEKQFHTNWKIATYVDKSDIVPMAEEDVAEEVSGVNVDLIGYGMDVFVAEYSILARYITADNSMPAAGRTAVRHPRIASKKNLTSVQRYNIVLEEAKQLASIESQEKLELFDKVKNIM